MSQTTQAVSARKSKFSVRDICYAGLFAAVIGDPHRFRVGDTEVEVLFDDSAPSLQACLTGMCRQLQ